MCVSGWQLGRLVNKQQEEKKKEESFVSPYMYAIHMYVYIMEKFFIEFAQK